MVITIEVVSLSLGIVATILAVLAIFFSVWFYMKGNEVLSEIKEKSSLSADSTRVIRDKLIDRIFIPSESTVKKELTKELGKRFGEFDEDLKDSLNKLKEIKDISKLGEKIDAIEKKLGSRIDVLMAQALEKASKLKLFCFQCGNELVVESDKIKCKKCNATYSDLHFTSTPDGLIMDLEYTSRKGAERK